ncbi:MAG: nuclear transport factor 2 family protein [Wenzhouxiangella sp.]
MKIFTTLILFLALAAHAGTDQAEDQLRSLLDEFLAGAATNEGNVHERFWAEDLVYTSSSGQRSDKAEIMQGVAETAERGREPRLSYSGQDFDIRVFDDTAVVTFTLLATRAGASEMEFYNTGVFRKRDDRWQAIVWQATHAAAPKVER